MLSLVVMMVTAGFAWLGLWQYRRLRRVPAWNMAVIAVLSLIAMGLVARAANIGGEIRHPEVRVEQVPVTPEPTLARSLADYVNEQPWAWIASETLHFVGLSLLVGIVLLIDLRALGVMRSVPFGALERLLPWAAIGFGVNIVTGMLFFVARPEFYTGNSAFYWKLIFVLLASANTLYFFFDEGWMSSPGRDVRLVHEGCCRVGARAVGRRHVLGQHAALHRQFLLSRNQETHGVSSVAGATPAQRLAQ